MYLNTARVACGGHLGVIEGVRVKREESRLVGMANDEPVLNAAFMPWPCANRYPVLAFQRGEAELRE